MKQILLHTLALCGSLLALAGCSTEELATEPISGKPATLVATIGSNTNTRTGHAEDAPNGVKVTWIANDVINIYSGNPLANNTPVAFVCESIDGTTGAGTFGSEQIPVIGKPYFALYPATLTHELKLSMLGQTQASNKSMAHLSAYDAMCTQTDDWKTVDFTAASPSESSTSAHLASLITFDLQNLPATLGKPTKITLGCIDGSGSAAAVFKETLNDATSATSSLSLALGDGFTDITDENNRIKAYLMVAPATIPVGHKLTIAVACSGNTYQFTSNAVETEIKYEAGKRHTATVTGGVSWVKPFTGSTYTGAEEMAEAFAGGDGSAVSPFEIATAGQLRKLINGVVVTANDGYTGKFFKLTTDIRIDMAKSTENAKGNWTPIGTNSKMFQGTFDGDGHTISGTMKGIGQVFGFFGYAKGATITNLTVDATVSGDSSVGGIVGYASRASISNCTNKGTVTGALGSIGGIAGHGFSATISNCTNQGAITVTGGVAGCGGGIIGTTDSSRIFGCTNQGTVLGQAGVYFGGIAGIATNGGSSIIACYNTAAVTTFTDFGGGIAGGFTYAGSIVTACYNTGKIARADNSTTNIGTIVGKNLKDCAVNYCQWVLDGGNTELPAFPSSNEGTGTMNGNGVTAFNDNDVAALNDGIKAWNVTNTVGKARHCPFHFVAGTTAGPTLAAGAPE